MELVPGVVVPEFLRGGPRLIGEREGRFVTAIKCVLVATAFFVKCMALDSLDSTQKGRSRRLLGERAANYNACPCSSSARPLAYN